MMTEGRFDQPANIGFAGNIGQNAVYPKFLHGLFEPNRIDVGNRHLRPLEFEPCRDCSSNALRPAGHDH